MSSSSSSSWQKSNYVLQFCHELLTSASGRKDKEHQKTAMQDEAKE